MKQRLDDGWYVVQAPGYERLHYFTIQKMAETSRSEYMAVPFCDNYGVNPDALIALKNGYEGDVCDKCRNLAYTNNLAYPPPGMKFEKSKEWEFEKREVLKNAAGDSCVEVTTWKPVPKPCTEDLPTPSEQGKAMAEADQRRAAADAEAWVQYEEAKDDPWRKFSEVAMGYGDEEFPGLQDALDEEEVGNMGSYKSSGLEDAGERVDVRPKVKPSGRANDGAGTWIGRINESISELQDAIEVLQANVSPVLGPDHRLDALAAPAEPSAERSILASDLDNINDRIQATVRRIQNMKERLEL